MRINVHIERLVVDGAPGIDGDALRAAVADALAQRLAATPPALASLAVPSLRAHAPAAPMHTAESLGGGVAHALHGALAPDAGTSR